ncbi:MAG: hypothetical protein LDL13_03255 [Calditerrivibrio sp.]|nr:hypothetical protein [Calditerrivibrio sp.]MCA1932578.1 hypothetical protein [Calditerrivibrio sp.]MCA1980020.1 hypothetical protein [Calditerrivibrio sp.]
MAFVGNFEKVLGLLKNIYDNNRFLYEFLYKKGIDILNINSYDDFLKVPLLRKSDLSKMQIELPPFAGFVYSKPVKIFQSPGPINNVKLEDYEQYRFYKALQSAGFNSDDIVVNSFGYTVSPAGDMFDEACRYLNIPVFPLGPTPSEKAAEIVDTFSATAFIGTKTFLIKTAELCKKKTLRKAYLIAEKMSEDDRKKIKDLFGIDAFQGYGTAEVGLIATEGLGFSHMKIDTEKIFIEHLDPNNCNPTDLEDYGEAVVTFIDHRLPFIRLATGDLVSYEGSFLTGVYGRVDSSVKVKGVFIHYWDFENFCNENDMKCKMKIEHSDKNDIINIEISRGVDNFEGKFKKRFGLTVNNVSIVSNLDKNEVSDLRNWKN